MLLIPLTLVLRNVGAGYDLGQDREVNHLLYMDDLNVYGENENQVDSFPDHKSGEQR